MLPEKSFPGKRHSIMAGKYDPNSLGSVPFSPESERCMYCRDDRFIKFSKPPCKYLAVSKSKNQSFFNFAMLLGITPCNLFPPRLRTCNSVKFPMSCGIFPASPLPIWQQSWIFARDVNCTNNSPGIWPDKLLKEKWIRSKVDIFGERISPTLPRKLSL